MIPFLDLRAQYASIQGDIQLAVNRVFETGQYILGDAVASFESEFARYVGADHGIAVNSGTSALHLALLAAGVGRGDEVITVPVEMPYARHVYHIYAVRSADRTELQRSLQTHGVQTGIHYPIPVHLQEGYRDLGYGAGEFPEAERAAREVLSLPMYPELSNIQVEFVAAAVHHNVHAV